MVREWQHHPWRHGMALLAVTLGVALAFAVHLINSSALNEFSQAVRTAGGQPDISLKGARFGDAWFERVASDPAVELASPVLELDTYARTADQRRVAVRVLGLDTLRAAPLTLDLIPRPQTAASTNSPETSLRALDPDVVFWNAAAQKALGQPPMSAAAEAVSVPNGMAPVPAAKGEATAVQTLEKAKDSRVPTPLSPGVDRVTLQSGPGYQTLSVAGMVAAAGPPLMVMDLAGAQHHFGANGLLSRIDLRLAPGTDVEALLKRLQLPPGVQGVTPAQSEQRVSNLSRAYRVNLTVLALVALFVGAFLVFSVVSLSVAQRTPSLALLGVLGLSPLRQQQGVLLECAAVGAVGSALGLLVGAGLAQAALQLLAGDLGGGYFPGVTPRLQWQPAATLVFGLLGVAAAVGGGWWPARQAAQLSPAQALKGLGSPPAQAPPAWPGLLLLATGGLAALLPPVSGLPLAAYAAVAALLLGGVALVPAAVHLMLAAWPPPIHALALLAVQRARFQRHTATAAMAGVVASLALSVALTVMVASFRGGVSDWLGQVLPADLYARAGSSAAAAEQAWLPDSLLAQAAQLPQVQRVQGSRIRSVQLAEGRPAVVLVARELNQPQQALPLLRPPLPPSALQPSEVALYVSEAMVSLYGAEPGSPLSIPLGETILRGRVLGVWRDYARQFGTVAVARDDYLRLTGDTRINDLALWLAPESEGSEPSSAHSTQVQAALRALLPDPGLLEFASASELRSLSLRIFDRSFAVTTYLQAVAILIGLVGVASSLSAQVLARRKELGLLAHLGLTRRQIVTVVTAEAAAWVAAGTVVGLLLGLAISLVLVGVVNPQSFHWTMELVLPHGRLMLLCTAVLAAGVATAALSARHAAARQAVLSVREDW
jgi:putative ABC transport system permease protein